MDERAVVWIGGALAFQSKNIRSFEVGGVGWEIVDMVACSTSGNSQSVCHVPRQPLEYQKPVMLVVGLVVR